MEAEPVARIIVNGKHYSSLPCKNLHYPQCNRQQTVRSEIGHVLRIAGNLLPAEKVRRYNGTVRSHPPHCGVLYFQTCSL